MKIAHIVSTFPPYKGGMGNSVFNFVEVLSDNGYDVTVFTPAPTPSPSPTPSSWERGVIDGKIKFKIIRLKSIIKFGNAAFLPQLFWKLKSFDVIHLHYPFYGIGCIVLLRKIFFWKKTKLIIHYHMEPTAKGLKGLLFKLNRLLIEPLLIRAANIITCASLDYVAHSSLENYYKKNKGKFRETFFGVDVSEFRITNYELRITNKDYKNILFVGGLDKAHYFKGVSNLLKAVSKLKFENWRLEIVGDGDMRPKYEKMACEMEIADRVNFAGRVSDKKLPGYYQNCDVLVLPSINSGEAFGMVLLEAMASSKPIIASNLPGVRNVFENGKQGLLVEPENYNDLAEKIKIILSDDNLAEKMGEAGRKLVEEKYAWEKVGERLDGIYREVKSL